MKLIRRSTRNKRTIFYIANEEIGIETSLQFFIIKPSTQYTAPKFKLVRQDIINRKVKNIVELINLHQDKIIMIYSQKEYWLERQEQGDDRNNNTLS